MSLLIILVYFLLIPPLQSHLISLREVCYLVCLPLLVLCMVGILLHTIVVHYQDLGWRGHYHPWVWWLQCHCEGLVWLESNLVVDN